MKGKTFIIHQDGDITEFDHAEPLSLEFMQGAVGGDCQQIPGFTKFRGVDCAVFCNEEGKLKGLPKNHVATNLWAAQIPLHFDFLVGDVLIVTGDKEFMEEL